MSARRSSWQKVHILYYIFNLELKTYNDSTNHTYHTDNVKKMLQLLSHMSNLQLFSYPWFLQTELVGLCNRNNEGTWEYFIETEKRWFMFLLMK